MTYKVEFLHGRWWITKDGKVIEVLGSFVDPISPKKIVEEIEKNG